MQSEKSMDYPKSPLGEIQGIFTSLQKYRSIIEKRLSLSRRAFYFRKDTNFG
jgi:hypothetical protein